MNQQSPASLPEQCIQCAHNTTRGGYLVLPAREDCDAAQQLASGPLAEVLSHLLRVAARVEPCPVRHGIEAMPDAFRAADLPPPLGTM